MLLSHLLHRLKPSDYEIEMSADIEQEIYGIKMLTAGQDHFEKDTLYFGKYAAFNYNAMTHGPISLLVYDAAPDSLDISRIDCEYNLIHISEMTDPFYVYNQLQDFFLEEHNTSIKMKRLLSALVSNNGIDYMVDEAYKVFQNPIFIVDNSYHYIAKSIGEDQIIEGSHYKKTIGRELEIDGIMEEGLAFIKDHHIDGSLGDVHIPYEFYNEIYKKNSLILPIRVHTVEVARMMLLEEFHPFTCVDRETFYRFSFLVAQELQKSAFYSSNRGQLFSYFLIDLLKADSPNLHNITRRLGMLKYELKEAFHICTISFNSIENNTKKMTILVQELQNILTGHIYAIFNQQLVILFNLEKDHALSDYAVESLTKSASVNDLFIGFSNPFTNIIDIRDFYKQSTKTIEYALQTNKKSGLFYYKDFTFYEMLSICQSQTDLLYFCDPDLMRLLTYDNEHRSDLMLTLYHYLEETANSLQAAKALFIHKNTLLYRLDKIRSILNNPLSKGDDLFKYHQSFRILIHLGLFSPNPVKDLLDN